MREIPYQVNKTRLIERIADLVNDKRIEGISDLRDESDRDGMRIVIELKRDAEPKIVLNQLYKLTQMQESYGLIMLSIHEGRPRELNLREMLLEFLRHRQRVIVRRSQFELRQAEARLHILEGLLIALRNLDAVIKLIRESQDAEARAHRFDDALQPDAAAGASDSGFDLAPADFAGAWQNRSGASRRFRRRSRGCAQILADEGEQMKMIAAELTDLRKEFADERRTQILDAEGDFSIEDLIVEEDALVTVTHGGYIKRTPLSLYRTQKRGGRGKIGANPGEEDFVEHLVAAGTHDRLLFFTSAGKVYAKKVYELPEGGRAARGRSVANLLSFAPDETLSAFLPVPKDINGKYVFFATRRGLVKKTALEQFDNIRANGIIAINLEEGDELIGVRTTDGEQQIVLSTREGQAIRFSEAEVRPMGRGTYGVAGMEIEKNKKGEPLDEVVSIAISREDETLLTVSEKGFGKRTEGGGIPADSSRGQGRDHDERDRTHGQSD